MGRWARILSIALITAGAVILLDVGLTLTYREPISSIYGSIRQGQAADELADLEARYPAPSDLRRVAEVPDRRKVGILARRFERRIENGEGIGRIKAPTMDGLDAVIVEGTDTGALQKGPGHYRETALPGAGGTVAIAGHRTTYLAPFRHIDSVERGDEILLEMPYAGLVYEVERTTIVDPGQLGLLRDVGYERLVLSACHPLFSAAQRYLVFARLQGARPA